MTKCEMKITLREHDDQGTEFRAKITSIQGIYDAEIGGKFRHWDDNVNASTWEPNQWAKVNTQEYTIEDVYALLGNGDPDLGVEMLDMMLVPVMEDDHALWLEAMEQERVDAEYEYKQNVRFYERQTGF